VTDETEKTNSRRFIVQRARRWVGAVGLNLPFSSNTLRTSRPLEERDVELAFLYYIACYAVAAPPHSYNGMPRYFALTRQTPHIKSTGFSAGHWEHLLKLKMGAELRRLPKDIPAPSIEEVTADCRMRYAKKHCPGMSAPWTRDADRRRAEDLHGWRVWARSTGTDRLAVH
jgi:hypothetical protein